jgi:autotransporter family porin
MSGHQCATLIAAIPEHRLQNSPFNRTVPTIAQLANFHRHPVNGAGPPPEDFARVDGGYSGTTEMILRWAACKWGIDEDTVRAQAWTESKWIQGGQNPGDGGGDRRLDRNQCVRADFDALWDFGCKNCCFQSWGILQTKVFYVPQTWPTIKDSTSFNADYRYAVERACINGGFINYFASEAQQPNTYAADVALGNVERLLWGCTGMHYSGSWYDKGAVDYISDVRRNQTDKPWSRLH